jgi:transaldolase
MKFFLDSAHIHEIEYALEKWHIDGVTTNPRHVQASGKPFLTVIQEIARLFAGTDKTISVEVNPHHDAAKNMVEEALKLAPLSPNFVIKLPATEAGFEAVARLKAQGIRANLTLCFSPMQALQAMRMGAFYVSPFVGWKESNGEEIVTMIHEIVTIRDNYNFQTEVLIAAVRNARQIVESALAGADIVTAGFSVYQEGFQHPFTDSGLAKFQSFWDRTQYE